MNLIAASLGKRLVETIIFVAAIEVTQMFSQAVGKAVLGAGQQGEDGPVIVPASSVTINIGNKAHNCDFNIEAKSGSENASGSSSNMPEFTIAFAEDEEE